MLVPTLGVALVPLNSNISESEITDWFVIGLGLFAFVVCLPYAIYAVVNVVNADLLNLPETHLKVHLIIIVLVVGLLGYWAGTNNYHLLTCGDFKIAGDELPEYFRAGSALQF